MRGIGTVYLSCYPEGHPRISAEQLERARVAKLATAEAAGFSIGLVSQFCFESAPIIEMARQIRAQGIRHPLRLGLAGPSGPAVLLKYAMRCGVGPSIRALRERKSIATNAMAGATEGLLAELAGAAAARPVLGIGGVHFFTFGSLVRTAEMIARLTARKIKTA